MKVGRDRGGDDKPKARERADAKQRRFDEMKSGQQRRIAENNPSAPVEKPKGWTDEDEAAAEQRRKANEDNPRGGRYRHR